MFALSLFALSLNYLPSTNTAMALLLQGFELDLLLQRLQQAVHEVELRHHRHQQEQQHGDEQPVAPVACHAVPERAPEPPAQEGAQVG